MQPGLILRSGYFVFVKENISMKTVKLKVKFDFRRFISTFLLWLVGVLLSLLPILYKNLYIFLNAEEKDQPINFINNFLMDQDFVFIGFSSGFLLFLELFFLEPYFNKTLQKVMGGFLIAYTLILIIFYTISYFSVNWVSRVGESRIILINGGVMLFLLAAGFLVSLGSSIEFSKRVVVL